MAAEDDIRDLYSRLRKAVASDVRRARRDFCALLAGPPKDLAVVLELASRPGEGRVRQMMATAARVEPLAEDAKQEMGRWLLQWSTVESDEFARSAIAAAIHALEPAGPTPMPSAELPSDFMAAYQFAAERLCHRVRNVMTTPIAMVVRLEQLAGQTSDPAVRAELGEIVSRLRPAMQRLSRVVEFDTEDDHVQWRELVLGDWLQAAAQGLASRYGQATLTLIGSERAKRSRVRAMPFLLETAFGNLWTNAVQAVEQSGRPGCHITIELNVVDRSLDVLVRDCGPGFPTAAAETAFRFRFSTKSDSRGRGLLEVADAVAKLQGAVKLVPVAANEHRILIRLPLEPQ